VPDGVCRVPSITPACTSTRPTRPSAKYRRAVDIDAENADAHFNLALILGPRRHLEEAIEHLRRALAVNPQHANVHRTLGIALVMQGRREEAIQGFREALRIQPDLAEARQNLNTLLNAR
jgi:tetratricopeptide (TPR) repeat protein